MQIKILIFIAIIAMVGLFFFWNSKNNKSVGNKLSSFTIQKPQQEKINDKIIIVENVKLDYLKKDIQDFCNHYNQGGNRALPRLSFIKNKYIITFPYDIEFQYFCYFINYLKYPKGFSKSEYNPNLRAWCTTKGGDAWMTKELINKKVMIYIPDSDDEYDNVYLTTSDNIGFKMGFAVGYSHIKLDAPIFEYKPNPVSLQDIKNLDKIDF